MHAWNSSIIIHPLEWNYAAHSRSVHKPALRQVIVLDRPVLHRAVVPHQKVPDPPLVTIDEGRLNNVIGKCVDQCLGFPSLYSLDPGAIVAHDIEAFTAGYGMGPNDGMGDQRVAIYFRLSGRKGPMTGIVNLSRRGMLFVSVARQLGSGNSFARLL